MYNKTYLTNGIRVIDIPMDGVESVTLLVMVGVGSRYETKETNGLAHFAEHVFFKGSKKRPTAQEISATIDGMGGDFNAFTTKEFTGFYIKAPSKHSETMIDILSDVLNNPLLPEEEINRERGVIIEEMNMFEDMPMRKIDEIYEELLYGDTRLGRPIIGSKETILNISKKHFIEYVNKFYVSQNMVIAIAGKTGNSIKYIEKYFKPTKEGITSEAAEASDNQNKSALKVFKKQTEQTHIAIGFRGLGIAHPDRFVLEVLNVVLGAGKSSRLFNAIREEKGLAYYIFSNVEKYSDGGYLVAQAGVDTTKTIDAIEAIKDEYRKLTQKKVTEQELTIAKEYFKGKLILSLEDTEEVASFYAVQETLEKKLRTPKDLIEEIDKVTSEDIKRVAEEIIKPQKLNIVVLGPHKEEHLKDHKNL